ncbi:C1 family peptidase [Chitinophaga vietnamensis]|uniref:C1 family peptidase n=1 Tax=Chitinophaga vietnamensis TaxID=2593957 RepID=UPI00117735C9|nr:C1 family peptidase [Chitinophaga vietnamensis]
MRAFFLALTMIGTATAYAQNSSLIVEKNNKATSVKNQAMTGTCWCFSTTSLVESECLRKGQAELDLSEMFTVRNIYIEKARNYVLRQGNARFDEGGLGHDVIRAIATYGIVPESVYSGLVNGATAYNHSVMTGTLKKYLDSIIKSKPPIPDNWEAGFTAILDEYMGKPPATFEYNGKTYTPISFAKEVVKFDADDYATFTSFTHHPFGQRFVVEVPDNFSNGSYYNVPLEQLKSITKSALEKGYTVMWDADASNRGWASNKGYAMLMPNDSILATMNVNPEMKEAVYSQESRQRLYEELVTQDDHLMHITGIEKTPGGKTFFIVKNSWGKKAGPFDGYINVSEPYFAINTITIIVPKAALDKNLKAAISKQ